MIYPSYQLNPGDMFQVDASKVLLATGAPQTPHGKSRVLDMLQANERRYRKMEEKVLSMKGEPASSESKPETNPSTAEGGAEVEASASTDAPAEEGAGAEPAPAATEEQTLSKEDALELRRLRLECALLPAKLVIREDNQKGSKRAMQIRNFKDRIGYVLSTGNTHHLDVDELLDELQFEMRSLDMLRGDEDAKDAKEAKGENKESGAERQDRRKALLHKALDLYRVKGKKDVINAVGFDDLSTKEIRNLRGILKRDGENPVDEAKPYMTPWQPRPFMSPWVFVPRYLEVNHKICAAVYLRHPVARRGFGEVPTPFSFFTNQLAHNWYAERGG